MSSTIRRHIEDQLTPLLAPLGLRSLGWFQDGGNAGLLIGNVGSELWPAFSNSPQYADGLADPMDRWTAAVTEPIAHQLKADIRYPFGETIWPFQHYARQAMGIEQSPIGLLIHPEFGLWTAFRAALMFRQDLKHDQVPVSGRPCDSCVDKPCLNTCPVAAFAEQGFDYLSCKAHVASNEGKACFQFGCLARRSCPVGAEYAYLPEHQNFHMRAYV